MEKINNSKILLILNLQEMTLRSSLIRMNNNLKIFEYSLENIDNFYLFDKNVKKILKSLIEKLKTSILETKKKIEETKEAKKRLDEIIHYRNLIEKKEEKKKITEAIRLTNFL